MRYSPDTESERVARKTLETLIGVIGLHIAIFAGPKDRKGNSFFSFFFFLLVINKSTMCRV